MKFIHFADFHLDAERGPIDRETGLHIRVKDYLDVLDGLIDFAESKDVDLVLFAGDAFHKATPSQTASNLFAKRIDRLSRQCPVVLVVGNHDMPGPRNKASAVDIFQSVRKDNVIIGNEFKTHKISTVDGIVQVTTFPYPMRQNMLPEKEMRLDKAKAEKKLRRKISKTLQELSDGIEDEYPSIFLGHFTVTTCQYGSERPMIFGNDAHVNIMELSRGKWDYVALGHIHLFQILQDDPPIIYPGSIEHVNIGEEGERKGFIFGEITEESLTYEFVDVDVREYITIDLDVTKRGKKLMDYILSEIRDYDLDGCVVRIRIKATGEQHPKIAVAEIHQELESMNVCYVHSIPIHIDRTNVDREELFEDPIGSYSRDELLDAYFVTRGYDDKEIDGLLEVAETIIKEVENG